MIGPDDPCLGQSDRFIAQFASSGLTLRGGSCWVDVRDVAEVHAAVMEPGRGPRRSVITGRYVAAADLTAMLLQITGRHSPIVALPAGAARAAGRVADLVQRIVPGQLPLSYESVWAATLQAHCDDSKTVNELDITPRDLRQTLTDTIQWLADQGHLAQPARVPQVAERSSHGS